MLAGGVSGRSASHMSCVVMLLGIGLCKEDFVVVGGGGGSQGKVHLLCRVVMLSAVRGEGLSGV